MKKKLSSSSNLIYLRKIQNTQLSMAQLKQSNSVVKHLLGVEKYTVKWNEKDQKYILWYHYISILCYPIKNKEGKKSEGQENLFCVIQLFVTFLQ